VHTQQQYLGSLPCFTSSIQGIACVITAALYLWIMCTQRSRCAGVILLYRLLPDTVPPHVSLFFYSSVTARS